MTKLSYFCQKCGRSNTYGAELCENCGTRLLLIVEPPSARFEINYATPYEEHLLERISLLESYLGRMTDRFDRILELMMRQAQTSYLDHTLLETLISLLEGEGVVKSRDVNNLWRARRRIDSSRSQAKARTRLLQKHIIGHHKSTGKQEFSQKLMAGLALMEKGRVKAGVKLLEEALLLSPTNGPLLFLLGQHFFFAHKTNLASDYLAQSLLDEPGNGLASLLLGVLCGDRGEIKHAKTLLGIANGFLGANFPAQYALGRIHVAEGSWPLALSCFKKACAAQKHGLEAKFALACAYTALKRFKLAGRLLLKIVEEDENYAEAWYRLGLLAINEGETNAAQEYFRAASTADKTNPVFKKMVKQTPESVQSGEELPLFGYRHRSKKTISGGDKRLASFLMREIATLCQSYPTNPKNSGAELTDIALLDDELTT